MNAIRFNTLTPAREEGARHRPVPASRLARIVPTLGAVAMMVVIGGFYVFREHLAPGGTAWLYLLLLACPLIHLCAHGGSSGSTPEGRDFDDPTTRTDTRRDADRDELRYRRDN
jgi:hypothetical protein